VSDIIRAYFVGTAALLALSCNSDDGGGRGNKADQLFESDDRLTDTLCACEMFDCTARDASCQRDVFSDHADEISSWLDCALDASAKLHACVKRADCDGEAIDLCFNDSVNMVCGDVPPRAAQAIQEDVMDMCVANGGDGDGDMSFECDDGGMINTFLVCDGSQSCADGSDETLAACDSVGRTPIGPVTMPMFTCADAAQIPLDFVCDTEDDCPDGADEARCFTCPSGSETIRLSMVCDGVPDCTLGDDETGPGCMGAASSLFECGNGEKVFGDDVCDGTPDCTKGDDEENCFTCADDPARIMRVSMQCDGVPDCEDAGDEQGCGPLPTALEVCTEMATPVAGTVASAECLACTCDAAAAETLACGTECWAALECVSTRCGEAVGNEKLTCIITNCMSSALQMQAQDLFEAAGTTCGELCPALVSTSPL
jgi:hypothetical protein